LFGPIAESKCDEFALDQRRFVLQPLAQRRTELIDPLVAAHNGQID
jgi:hypothetical protein